jgi:pyruvate dehydrogenase E2 component (dihydrolipoamide acetyltransferase)
MQIIAVPDIGDFKDVSVIEVLIVAGDAIVKDQPVAILESDKATMEIPSPVEGLVTSVDIKVGDKVSVGSALLKIEGKMEDVVPHTSGGKTLALSSNPPDTALEATATDIAPGATSVPKGALPVCSGGRIYAGPTVRKLARELCVDLHEVKGSGPRGRITPRDVHFHVTSMSAKAVETEGQGAARAPSALGPLEISPWPKVNHARFGPIEPRPLSRIRKATGANLHRNWVSIPHVTNHDDADVTELEAFRTELNRENVQNGVKISPLAFAMKACATALKRFPEFNASLEGDTLILKHYYHIGVAVDTPNGLVVPVIKDVDLKGIVQIARDMAELAGQARAGGLAIANMQGASFSISSLGGIGGSYFTPIINAPEVAILGLGKIQTRVVWADGRPEPRSFLPLSLSWDHRVVDGAAAGRFNAHVVSMLSDLKRLLL